MPGPIAAHCSGQGRAILLVHGFPLEGSMWSAAADLLAADFRVIVPDLRGFGRSPPSSETKMATYADDLAALLDQELLERPALVAGLSFGGYVVMEFLRRHPERVGALGLIDTRESPDTADAAAGRRAQALRLDAGEPVSIVVEPMMPLLAAPTASPSFLGHWRRIMSGQDPMGVASALRAMADRPDSTGTLRAFSGPALVVAGEHDAITPVTVHQRMAGLLADPVLRVLPRAGHLAPAEQPEAFARVVREFLGR